MRRLPILLAFGLVFALLVVAAATAAAPDFCNEDSPKYDLGHPTCSTTTTVTPPDPTVPPLAACETDISVPIEGKGRGGYECLWTPENDGQAEGKVTFTNMVGIKHGVVIVRDDAPGTFA